MGSNATSKEPSEAESPSHGSKQMGKAKEHSQEAGLTAFSTKIDWTAIPPKEEKDGRESRGYGSKCSPYVKLNEASEDALIRSSREFDANDFDASDDPFIVNDASQTTYTTFFQLDITQATPVEAPEATFGRYRLYSLSIKTGTTEKSSVHTFPVPIPSQPFEPILPGEDEVPDPMDSEPVPLEQDELLAANPGTFEGDGYPRPFEARPGHIRMAPNVTVASDALIRLLALLKGKSRGKCGGYHPPEFDAFTRIRLEGMRAMLSHYTTPGRATYEKWGESALTAAIGLARGNHCARVLAKLCRSFIEDNEVLPVNPYGYWQTSMLADEDLANDIRLYLQELGKDISVDKLVEYLHREDVKEKHGIQ